MVIFPIQIPDCDPYIPALLDFFLSSDATICSITAFLPLENPDHVVFAVSIDFSNKLKTGCLVSWHSL